MAKMHLFFLCLALMMVLGKAQAQSNSNDRRYDNTGRYNPHYQDNNYRNGDYFNSRYYKNTPDYYNNRNYYNNRQYYDARFKNYNPSVVASEARIIEQDVTSPDNGAYSYSFKTENGIQAEERGVAVNIGKDEQKEVVEGSYSFVTPEGLSVLVRYTADENGFHPVITYGGVDGNNFARRARPAEVVVTDSN